MHSSLTATLVQRQTSLLCSSAGRNSTAELHASLNQLQSFPVSRQQQQQDAKLNQMFCNYTMHTKGGTKNCFLKVICNGFFTQIDKVVSNCLLQYKPVYVINFDELCRQNAKK